MKNDDRDFVEFQNAKGESPSIAVTETIRARVAGDLTPSTLQVMRKLLGIHLLSSLITLSICPQFGFRLMGQGHGLMGYFMYAGTYGCQILCGGFFLFVSIFIARWVLSPAEWRQLESQKLLQFSTLSLVSMGLFLMISKEFVLAISAAWFVGTIIGAYSALKLQDFLKTVSV